jgi:hypothetical protein
VGGRLPAQSVADIVKSYAERVGLDPAQFAGHSMRSGFLTSAAERGVSIFKMMDQSRQNGTPEKPTSTCPMIGRLRSASCHTAAETRAG